MSKTRAEQPYAEDQRKLRAASVRVGLTVAAASAALVALLGIVTVLYIVSRSRWPGDPDDHRGPGRHGGPDWRDRVVDVDEVVTLVAILALIGVVLLGVIAWYVARQSTKPLAEAMRLQRNFVADASHELRTPLTTLDSRVQVAQHRLAKGEDIAPALGELRQDAAALGQILDDLLLTAEGPGGPLDGSERCDVGAAAAEATRLIEGAAQERGVTVKISLDSGPLLARASGPAVVRALVILLDNAVGFSSEGETVTLSASQAGTVVRVRVHDSGPGITGIDTEQLFERFTRGDSDRRGSGLGLSMARDIAARSGGRVFVEDTGPRGTVFQLELPAA